MSHDTDTGIGTGSDTETGTRIDTETETESDTLCAIPARGGSKRLPRKNVLPLAGKPMVAHSIEAAREAGFEDVYVCTDDEEIAGIAREYGARVPELMPAELCGDLVASYQPCQYLADRLAEWEGREFETLLCLQPTSPLRSAGDIERGLDQYDRGDYRFLMSVTHIDPHYFHWALQPNKGNANEEGTDGREVNAENEDYWGMYFGEEFVRERPELPDVYRPNGSVKIADLDTLAARGSFFGERLGTIETPPERSIHVGTRFDFECCAGLLARTDGTRSTETERNETNVDGDDGDGSGDGDGSKRGV